MKTPSKKIGRLAHEDPPTRLRRLRLQHGDEQPHGLGSDPKRTPRAVPAGHQKRDRVPQRIGSRQQQARITRNVPGLTTSTLSLSVADIDGRPKSRLLGPPRSGFRFTPKERALIARSAPSMPEADCHKIPTIDVKLTYLVEEHIQRLKETAQSFSLKSASRELGVVANPKKGRRRAGARPSEAVVHLLASRLLLRNGTTSLNAWSIDAIVEKIRLGSVPFDQLQIAAREVRALGALNRSRRAFRGTTTNEALWHLGCHVLVEWQSGMKLEPKLSQDFIRDDDVHEGVHSELVMLVHALHQIAVCRLWADQDLMTQTVGEPITMRSPAEVYWSLMRIRAATETGQGNSAIRDQTRWNGQRYARVDAAIKRLRRDVLIAQFKALLWIYHGREVKRR
jgi:hypothetical protein